MIVEFTKDGFFLLKVFSLILLVKFITKGFRMSEYQYHEWQSLDRPLTAAEQNAVDGLSSHIDVTSTQAIVTYHWSNFKHDPIEVLAKLERACL